MLSMVRKVCLILNGAEIYVINYVMVQMASFVEYIGNNAAQRIVRVF